MNISWIIKSFEELSLEELYASMVLRQEVFVVEQDCPYVDADGRDQKSIHVLGLEGSKLVAYSRVTLPGTRFVEVGIGRIITSEKVRGTGIGMSLMDKSLAIVEEQFGKVPVRISAQTYLIDFYKKFNFRVDSEEYLEDNIPHVEMLRTA